VSKAGQLGDFGHVFVAILMVRPAYHAAVLPKTLPRLCDRATAAGWVSVMACEAPISILYAPAHRAINRWPPGRDHLVGGGDDVQAATLAT
jgi:hypothetical protein